MNNRYNGKTKNLFQIARLFLKLGSISFGGPAVHIAMFEEEIVSKRKWMDHQHFLDFIGATNLIPGPNSTELALHTGYYRAGITGLIAAGICFTLPAVTITGIFAYIYSIYGNLPAVQPFLYGIKPAIIIVVLNAVYKLGLKAIKGKKLLLIAVAISVINFCGVDEVFSILFGGIFGALVCFLLEKKNVLNSFSIIQLLPLLTINYVSKVAESIQPTLLRIFLSCFKIGAVWFGGGYVLVAYFNGEFVEGLHWLSKQELLDAIAVGQFTPGPFLSSATFIGFQIGGIGGAIAATLGIILPSIIFVLLLNPIVPKLRRSKFFSLFLDTVNVSAVAVMFVVAIKLGFEILYDQTSGINWTSVIIAAIAGLSYFTFKKINSAYIVLGGAVLGYILRLL